MLVIDRCVTSYPPKLNGFIFSPFLWVGNLGVALAVFSGSGSVTGCNQVSAGAAVNSARMVAGLLPSSLAWLLGAFSCWLKGLNY